MRCRCFLPSWCSTQHQLVIWRADTVSGKCRSLRTTLNLRPISPLYLRGSCLWIRVKAHRGCLTVAQGHSFSVNHHKRLQLIPQRCRSRALIMAAQRFSKWTERCRRECGQTCFEADLPVLTVEAVVHQPPEDIGAVGQRKRVQELRDGQRRQLTELWLQHGPQAEDKQQSAIWIWNVPFLQTYLTVIVIWYSYQNDSYSRFAVIMKRYLGMSIFSCM